MSIYTQKMSRGKYGQEKKISEQQFKIMYIVILKCILLERCINKNV